MAWKSWGPARHSLWHPAGHQIPFLSLSPSFLSTPLTPPPWDLSHLSIPCTLACHHTDASNAAHGGQVLIDAATFTAVKEAMWRLGAVGPAGLDYDALLATKFRAGLGKGGAGGSSSCMGQACLPGLMPGGGFRYAAADDDPYVVGRFGQWLLLFVTLVWSTSIRHGCLALPMTAQQPG
jgi:hypothetical protein